MQHVGLVAAARLGGALVGDEGEGRVRGAVDPGDDASSPALERIRVVRREAEGLEEAAARLDRGGSPEEQTEARAHLEALYSAMVRARAHLNPSRPLRVPPRRR